MLLYSLPLLWFGLPETLGKFAPPTVGSSDVRHATQPGVAPNRPIPPCRTRACRMVDDGAVRACPVAGDDAPSGRYGRHRLVADAPVQSLAVVVVFRER